MHERLDHPALVPERLPERRRRPVEHHHDVEVGGLGAVVGQHAAADERDPRVGEVGGDEVGGCLMRFHAQRLPSRVVLARTVCHSGRMIDTWLTETFDLSLPVVGAPMAGPGEGPLAAAVSAAGGLGMVGVNASRTPEWVVEQAGVAGAGGAAYGIGLMAWVLERDEGQLDAVLEVRPALVSVSFGGFEAYVDRLRDAGIRVTVQAGTVEEARRAEAAGADFVVARGAEGGGHGRNDVGTLPLLQAVLDGGRRARRRRRRDRHGPRTGRGARGGRGRRLGRHGAARPPTRRGPRRQPGELLLAADGHRHGLRPGLRRRAAARLARGVRRPGAPQRLLRPVGAPARRARDRRRGGGREVEYVYAGQGAGLLTEERSVADVLAELATAEDLLRRF